MKPLVERIFELLEEKARRLFDPESSRGVPATAPTKPHEETPEKSVE